MTQQPPSLNYATPTAGLRPLRKKAVRQCRGNGIGCILIGILIAFGAIAVASRVRAGFITVADAILLASIAGLFALVYFASGIIHIVASFKIRQSNPFWEKAIFITAGIHIFFVILWLGLLAVGSARSGNVSVLPIIIAVVIILSLAQGISAVKKARAQN